MSKDFTVVAKAGKAEDSKSASINISGPETVEEAIEMYGGEAVLTNAMANWRVTLQGGIRAGIKTGLDDAQIQEKLGSSKMGVSQPRGSADPVAAMMGKWSKMDDKAKKAFMAQLKAAA